MIKFINIVIFNYTMDANNSLIMKNDEISDRNILANLFTKCGDCKLRHNCQIHKERIELATEEIKLKKEKIDKYVAETNNDVDRHKKASKELSDFSKLVWNKFDESIQLHECDYEKQEVIEDVTALQSKYNFTDPRVFIIVKQHLKQAILDFRAFKDSSRQSLITYKYTEDGSKIPIINPILNYKLQSGKFVIDLIKTLDTITKEDELLDEIKTSGTGFYTKYLSKIPHNIVDANIVDDTPTKDEDADE